MEIIIGLLLYIVLAVVTMFMYCSTSILITNLSIAVFVFACFCLWFVLIIIFDALDSDIIPIIYFIILAGTVLARYFNIFDGIFLNTRFTTISYIILDSLIFTFLIFFAYYFPGINRTEPSIITIIMEIVFVAFLVLLTIYMFRNETLLMMKIADIGIVVYYVGMKIWYMSLKCVCG